MSLQEELKMNRGFESVQQEALISLARTQNVIDPFFSSIFSEFKITAPQYNVLRILKGCPDPHGMPCTSIGERMVTRDSDITRLVDKLEKASLVERYRPESDRRKVLVKITEQGLSLLKQIHPKLDQTHHALLKHVPEPELQTLVKTLAKIRLAHT